MDSKFAYSQLNYKKCVNNCLICLSTYLARIKLQTKRIIITPHNGRSLTRVNTLLFLFDVVHWNISLETEQNYCKALLFFQFAFLVEKFSVLIQVFGRGLPTRARRWTARCAQRAVCPMSRSAAVLLSRVLFFLHLLPLTSIVISACD